MLRNSCLFVACLLGGFASTQAQSRRPIDMSTHRGADRLAPENTMTAARAAVAAGTTYLEIDVRRSQDGTYYDFHDDTLGRTTNGTGPLESIFRHFQQ